LPENKLIFFIGVLQRHESLAANLGAKLVGPLLLKSFEKLFDGPIKTIQSSFALDQSPITWLDIVTFARTNPTEFYLSEHSSVPGAKSCRFWIKGGQVEVSEDDYRLIMSGGPERMIPTQPIAEDESAELATLNILEGRLAILIKKADAVASKARQLNYHLKGRKTAVLSRKAAEPVVIDNERTQPFSAINAHTRSPAPPNSEAGKLQQQLLEQFLSSEHRRQSLPASAPHSVRPKASRVSTADPANFLVSTFNGESPTGIDNRRTSHPPTSSEDGLEGHNKVLMASRIEKLVRGDRINPPCDRCRRLKFECTKHLTACQACTKKHAKCSWKDIREGELDFIPTLAQNALGQNSGSENGNGFVVTEPAMQTGGLDETRGVGWGSLEIGAKERERQDNLAEEAAMLTQIAAAASR
jgi:hypothetical protein